MNSVTDTVGHKSHTSSIAGENYVDRASFFGYASETHEKWRHVSNWPYKIVWDERVYTSGGLAAMNLAVADNIDMMSISLGFGNDSLYEDPIVIASFDNVEKGVLISCSAGNEWTSFENLHNGIFWL